jgi:hypothetical protein
MIGVSVSLVAANFVSTGLGAFAAAPTETVTESTATKGTYTIKLAAADAAATGAGLLSVVLTTKVYDEVDAFGDLGATATLSVNSSDPAVSIAALNAQVTALTGQVGTLTSDYNSLATKYNKLVKKSKRVAKK